MGFAKNTLILGIVCLGFGCKLGEETQKEKGSSSTSQGPIQPSPTNGPIFRGPPPPLGSGLPSPPLKLPAPLSGVPEDRGSFTVTHITFAGIKGDVVPGYLYMPKDLSKGKVPGIMFQYGIGGSKDSGYVVEVGEEFALNGFAVLTIDAPQDGERSPTGGHISKSLQIMSVTLLDQYEGDFHKAIDYMVSRPEVDASRIAYGGASLGGIVGVPFVAKEPRIKAAVAVVTGGNFYGVIPVSHDPVKYVKSIEPRPILLVNALRDEVILRPFADALHAAAGPHAQKVWLDTNHTFNGYDHKAAAKLFIEFAKNALK